MRQRDQRCLQCRDRHEARQPSGAPGISAPRRNQQRILLSLLAAVLALAALRGWAQEPVPDPPAAQIDRRSPALIERTGIACGPDFCRGQVGDLFVNYVIFEGASSAIYLHTTTELATELANLVGCTNNYWLIANDENRFAWVDQLSIAEALGSSVQIHFEPTANSPTLCQMTRVYRFFSN